MNILMVFSDQQHKYALGKSDRSYWTPNLDQLCENGVLFENAYSCNPICGPYRACLMTGQHTSRCGAYHNGDPLPHGTPTLAQTLQMAGYETSFVGKWHLGGGGNEPIPEVLRGGFQHFIGYQCYNGFDPHPPYNNHVFFYDEENQVHIFHKHRTDVTTDLAISRLCDLKQIGKPFFLLVGYQAPHYPEQPSPEYEHLYDHVSFQETPDYQAIDPYTPTYDPRSPRPETLDPDYQRYGNRMERYQQLYAGLVSQIDAGVGRILKSLDSLGLSDDTLVIYTSDHGDMQGSHGRKNKGVPYEKSCGVPLIMRLPGGRTGVRCQTPVSSLDLNPTMLDAANAGALCKLDGRSLYGYLAGEQPLQEDVVISEYLLPDILGYPWKMARDSRYKLVVNAATNTPTMFFDMQEDPYELHDLKDHPESRSQIQSLLAVLQQRTSPLDLGKM